mmetsp:Transcript_6219/g.28520  ORF Transcript_6219/g.28520 Transcript_6219/m.28520 type:complete len:282 (+) Transcript_6219:3148-3993(+)
MRRGPRRERERVLGSPKRFRSRRRRHVAHGTEAEHLREEVLTGDGDVVVAAVPVPGVVVLGGGFLGRGFLGGLAAFGRRDDQLGFLVGYSRHERSERRERVPVAKILRRALVLCQRREHRGSSLRPYVRILLRRRHRGHQLGDSVEVIPVHDAAERLARVRARELHQPQRQHPRRLIPRLLARRVLRGALQRHLQDIRRFLRVLRRLGLLCCLFGFALRPQTLHGYRHPRGLDHAQDPRAMRRRPRQRGRQSHRLGRDAPTRMRRRRRRRRVRVPLRLFLS